MLAMGRGTIQVLVVAVLLTLLPSLVFTADAQAGSSVVFG